MSSDNKPSVLYIDTTGRIHRSLVTELAVDPDGVRPRKAILTKIQSVSFKKGPDEIFRFSRRIVRPMDQVSVRCRTIP